MNLRSIGGALAVVALAATLSACSTTSGASSNGPAPSGSNRPTSTTTSTTASASPTTSDSPTSEPTQETAAFGKPYAWQDGLTVTITKKAFKASEYAAGAEAGKPQLRFDVVLVNKTGKPFDANLFQMTIQSGNTEAQPIFDTEQKISGPPNTKLLNGREAAFSYAFSVENPNDIVAEVTPDFEHEAAIFQS